MWFAAHIVTVFRYRNRRQRKYHVWENVVLIEAATSKEAWEKAETIGKAEAAHDDPSLTINGIPARLEFAGIRKVVAVDDPQDEIGHGTEVTYNKFNVASKTDLEKLICGEPVPVEYEE